MDSPKWLLTKLQKKLKLLIVYDYLTKNGYEEVSKKFAKAILKKKILVVFAQIKFRVRDTLTLKKKRGKLVLVCIKISSNSNASNSSKFFA